MNSVRIHPFTHHENYEVESETELRLELNKSRLCGNCVNCRMGCMDTVTCQECYWIREGENPKPNFDPKDGLVREGNVTHTDPPADFVARFEEVYDCCVRRSHGTTLNANIKFNGYE